jgi:hypothetical protein
VVSCRQTKTTNFTSKENVHAPSIDPTTVILQDTIHQPTSLLSQTDWDFGFIHLTIFVSYTLTHNNEDVYHHRSNSWGQGQLGDKKGPERPRATT